MLGGEDAMGERKDGSDERRMGMSSRGGLEYWVGWIRRGEVA